MGPSPLLCALLACLPAAGGSAPTPPHSPHHLSLSPAVQLLDELGGASTAAYLFNAYSFIAVDTANAANLFAARGLQATLRNTTHLRLALVPLRSVFAAKAAIVIGALDDPNTTALAAGRNLTAAVPTEPRAAGLFAAEGYVLDIRDEGVVLAGASEAGRSPARVLAPAAVLVLVLVLVLVPLLLLLLLLLLPLLPLRPPPTPTPRAPRSGSRASRHIFRLPDPRADHQHHRSRHRPRRPRRRLRAAEPHAHHRLVSTTARNRLFSPHSALPSERVFDLGVRELGVRDCSRGAVLTPIGAVFQAELGHPRHARPRAQSEDGNRRTSRR